MKFEDPPKECMVCHVHWDATPELYTVVHTTPNGGFAMVHERCMLEKIAVRFYENEKIMVVDSTRPGWVHVVQCTVKRYHRWVTRENHLAELLGDSNGV